MFRLSSRALTFGAAIIFLGGTVLAQGPAPGQAPPPPAQLLSPQQLDDIVAPVALYPDPLISQVLVASTYPLELVQAQQWLQQNRSLSGQQLMDAARQQGWDASVVALVAMPDVLGRLNSDIRWTTDLGNAFLAQQSDVMAAVQRMRARAQANGKLSSTPQETVSTQTEGGQSAIQIVPTNPDVIYVPYYDPAYIWGPPVWGAYPYLAYPGYGFGFWPGIDIGFCFGGWGGWGWGGWGWGWGPNWFGGSVFVNHAFFNRYGFRGGFGGGFARGGFAGRSTWAHDPGHRLGVAYSNRQLASRFGAASMASRASLGQRSFGGARNAFGESYGGRSGVQGARSFQGSQGYRGSNFQSGAGRQSFAAGGAARSYGGNASRGFNGGSYNGAARSYGGGGAVRSYGGASNGLRGYGGSPAVRSYGGSPAVRSYGGGGAVRSYGGGSAPRSYGGGGGFHGFSGGGGGHSFGGGGGGFHGGGGGGSHGGGGGHGGGRR